MASNDQIVESIIRAIEQLNLARAPDQQLEASPSAPIFGAESPLDSLGLVALVIDIEDALVDLGHDISLSDEQTMSRNHSPFRSVATLATYIQERIEAQ